jgi:uncharacterized protein
MRNKTFLSVGILALFSLLGMGSVDLDEIMGKDEPAVAAPAPVVAAPAPKRVPNPGFDCAKARSWSSRTVCTDADLADLDREMNKVYKDRRSRMNEYQRDMIKQWQRAWRKNQRDNCEHRTGNKAQVDCLKRAHQEQIDAIKRY